MQGNQLPLQLSTCAARSPRSEKRTTVVVYRGMMELFAHVPCSFFGEGERENMGGIDVFLFDHVCYLGGYGRGLACACEDQLGGLCVFDGFKLAGFQG
ncbi:hypothetical protein ig2599ANME_1535 [groundwater metagenome]